MIRALASKDFTIVGLAITGLGKQHDEASLELIEKTIEQSPSHKDDLAFCLYAFRSEAADTIANNATLVAPP